jgi:hypothetical protein
MSWKDWVYGDLVSAAEFQSLVQDQTVQRYADSATRSSTLGSAVTEGMVSYLDDTNAVEVYRTSSAGSAWEEITPQAGRNAIINGAFDIWQRGTSFSNPANQAFTADRWYVEHDGTGATRTISQQTFTPGTAPVAGYEGQYFYRYNISAVGTGNTANYFGTRIEDGRTFAGQTATLSFWAKADAARTVNAVVNVNYGSGGSGNTAGISGSASLTTSWQRFTITGTFPSVAGKTFGAGSYIYLYFNTPAAVTQTIDIWGVQLEAGSTATSFKRNAPSIQAELAACQRYYYRSTGNGQTYGNHGGSGFIVNSTTVEASFKMPVTMRVAPTSVEFGTGLGIVDTSNVGLSVTAVSISAIQNTPDFPYVSLTVSGATSGRAAFVRNNNNAAGYIGFSAEL